MNKKGITVIIAIIILLIVGVIFITNQKPKEDPIQQEAQKPADDIEIINQDLEKINLEDDNLDKEFEEIDKELNTL